MKSLTEVVVRIYDTITNRYYDEKGCKSKYFNGHHCEYDNDCHHKLFFNEQNYCLKKEIGENK